MRRGFATRTVSRRRQIVVPRSSDILATSRSSIVIFKSQIKERYDSPSPDLESRAISSKIQALSGSLVAQSSRSSDRCLLHWRPPCGALDRFLGRLYSMYSFSGPVILLLFGRCGHRQISTVTRFQAHPSGFLHWARGPYSRAAGGFFLTGAVLKARSARGVPAPSADRCLNPIFLQGAFLPSQALLLH